MVEIEHSVIIDRPVDEVFEFVINPENEPLWIPGTLEAKQISEGPLVVGTRLRITARLFGQTNESTWEVTEYEKNRRRGAKSISGSMPYAFVESYESVEGGTKIDAVAQIEAGGLAKLAEPIIARMARRQMETKFANLKALMEFKKQ